MLLLGIDLGTSFIKVSVVDASTQKQIASAQFPEEEVPITTPAPGWAEQSPDLWWDHVQTAIQKVNASQLYDPEGISAIGIAYQMHGLVVLNKKGEVIRDSIIWCDSRAVGIGQEVFESLGKEWCLQHLLNSPGNFTASKMAWVKRFEPAIYEQIDKVMLPGDFIAFRFTGEMTTTPSALSEGVWWDFLSNGISGEVLTAMGTDASFFPEVQPVFGVHGLLSEPVARKLGLKHGIPVSYKAGDQPNNALALNVLKSGEVAATAGTSGVIYGVTNETKYDPHSRVNGFAHINHSKAHPSIGILLCINGTGVLNRWIRNTAGGGQSYDAINRQAASVAIGSDGLCMLPFGNGAERMLNNLLVGANISGIDLNVHTPAHLARAAQEGIAFAFRYGLDIMRENGVHPMVIRAGKSNMFQSEVFLHAFVNITGTPVELFESDGSIGAALGAGIGAAIFNTPEEAFKGFKPVSLTEPDNRHDYDPFYEQWKRILARLLPQ